MQNDQNTFYHDIAKKLTAKLIENLITTVKSGEVPDLYWKLENSILQALKYADAQGYQRSQSNYKNLIQNFDSEDGSTQN